MNRTDTDPGETHPGLWRPNGGLIVRSHHALRDGARRKLERWLTAQRIHWGYRGEAHRCLVVYCERSWLESKLRELGWTSTLSVERAA